MTPKCFMLLSKVPHLSFTICKLKEEFWTLLFGGTLKKLYMHKELSTMSI